MNRRQIVALVSIVCVAAAIPLALGYWWTTWKMASAPASSSPTARLSPSGPETIPSPSVKVPSVSTMTDRLKKRLAGNPGDLNGWVALARTHAASQRWDQAAEAYRRAIALRYDIAQLHAALAEILTLAAGGAITPEARDAIDKALAIDADEPRGRFYAALAAVQDGNKNKGLDMMAALLRDAGEGAPWAEAVRDQALALAREVGRDPTTIPQVVPPPRPAPAQSDIDAARGMSAIEQKEMIRGMVKRLEARLADNPNDKEGWRMLARSYGVQGRRVDQARALARLASLAPNSPSAQAEYAATLIAGGAADKKIGDGLIAEMRHALAVDPSIPEAHLLLAEAANQRGDDMSAALHYRRFLELAPNSPYTAPATRQLNRVLERSAKPRK